MKKFVIIMFAMLMLTISGCGQAENQELPVNNSGTQAVKSADSGSGNESLTVQDNPINNADSENLTVQDDPIINTDSDVVEIKEKMFIAQTNDIYLNPDEYLGKTIHYEGIFDLYTLEETGETIYYVIRYGPGCCGFDANAGFEVTWNDTYPNQNDWVEAEGVLEMYEEDGWQYLRLKLTSLTVLTERGEEYVYQ